MKRSVPRSKGGSSLVEFALIVPLLFLLFINVVNFGGFFYAWITVANAARAAANYRIMGTKTMSSPLEPKPAQVRSLVADDVFSLPNKASTVVRICERDRSDNTVFVCDPVGSEPDYPNPPADTRDEGRLYRMIWVDVVYTYQPFIPAFNFPGLGISLTLPSSSVRRQAVMRVMN